MRLSAIYASDVDPVKRFDIASLSDVVVIAGQNGVGKSRLIGGLLGRFQSLNAIQNNIRLVVEATSENERNAWQQNSLDTSIPADAQKLISTLQSNKSRTKWSSSVIHFESDRSIAQVQPYAFNWDASDPWGETLGWNMTFGGLKARFQDTLHSLFRKVQSNDKQIAKVAKELQASGHTSMSLNFPDPLAAFKEAFSQLLSPKKLLDLDPRDQQLYFEHDGRRLPVSALSSGEREVLNIVFDFILRAPSDCIIFFDEPEIHLHPELSYRLLQTLKAFGNRNQFIFCTHSPDIITASLENTVVFISPPASLPECGFKNQAITVAEDDETNNALRLLGQSIGIVSLGKKIVLIEGAASSLDKQTYGFILKNRFPNLVLVPSGGREVIESFQQLSDTVLSKTIWGVDFFMVCDRDTTDSGEISHIEQSAGGKLRYLNRYHLENYFLEPNVLSKVFEDIEPDGSWLRDEEQIRSRLVQLAIDTIPYATALIVAAQIRRKVGNVSIMPKGLDRQDVNSVVSLFKQKINNELIRTSEALNIQFIEQLVRNTYSTLETTCSDGSGRWIEIIPGKQILARFSALTPLDVGRIKLAYVKAAQKHALPAFEDITNIFEGFSSH